MVLGDFYRSNQDVAQAEREYRAAAEIAPVGSPMRVKLADFYLTAGRRDEAKQVLDDITQKAPEYLPAWRRRAEIALAEGKYEDSAKALETVLDKNAADLEGLLLRGRLQRHRSRHRQDVLGRGPGPPSGSGSVPSRRQRQAGKGRAAGGNHEQSELHGRGASRRRAGHPVGGNSARDREP